MNRCSTARRSYRYSLRYSCDARDIGFPAKFANCCPVVLKGRQIERRERVGVSILNHGETSVESQSSAKRWDTRERSFPLSLDYFTEKDYPTNNFPHTILVVILSECGDLSTSSFVLDIKAGRRLFEKILIVKKKPTWEDIERNPESGPL